MNKRLTIILFVLSFLGGIQAPKAQYQFTKKDIFFKAKVLTVQRTNMADSITLMKLLELYKVSMLPSKGFDTSKVMFIKVVQKAFILNSEEDIKRYKLTSSGLHDMEFILAYSPSTEMHEKFYRLKGFEGNDFKEFYDDASWFCTMEASIVVGTKLKDFFLETFYIQDLDLDCLFDSIQKRVPRKRRKKGFPCLQSALSQQIYGVQTHSDGKKKKKKKKK